MQIQVAVPLPTSEVGFWHMLLGERTSEPGRFAPLTGGLGSARLAQETEGRGTK